MSIPHNENELGRPFRSKKKRSAVFIVIVASVAVHVLGLGIFGVIKIVDTISTPPEFKAPPVQEVVTPPPPPPPPPTSKRTQRSLPRPQPLAAQNPQNMSVPTISIQDSDLSIGGGRGFGGGLGELGGGAMDSIRLTSFGFDRALEGTLEGSLYDFKQGKEGKPVDRNLYSKGFAEIAKKFTRNFNARNLERDFFKADTKLYASYFVIPFQGAEVAPKSFGAEGVVQPTLIGAYYHGTYKPRDSGRFRLVGRADDVLVVRINGKIVLDASLTVGYYSSWTQSSSLVRHDEAHAKPYFGARSITGDWFSLNEGLETEVDVFICEVPGGVFGAYLLIEKEGEPGLKIFSTRPLSTQDKEFLRKLHPDVAQFIE